MLHFPQTAENFLRYGLSFLLEGWKQEGLHFITWIHSWLCNSVLTGLLGDLATNTEQISWSYNSYFQKQSSGGVL